MPSTFDSADDLGLRARPEPDPRDIDVVYAREAVRARMFGAAQPIRIGRLELRERLGAGGMGIVYAAHDPELDRLVAVKLVRLARMRDRAAASERLRAEARALAQLDHPNVVKVYDVGEAAGVLYIAMELVRGTDLRGWLAQRRTLAEILAQFHAIALGVAAAHEAGIVHRDLKPENVLVGGDGRPRVADFGLARVVDSPLPAGHASSERPSASTRPAGTPGYVAPEILAGARADVRGDVYAFATTLFEALYGHLPADTPSAGPRTSTGERVPDRLRSLLEHALHADRDARVPTMHPLLEQLARGSRPRRRWAVVAAAGAIAIAGGAGLARRVAVAGEIARCEREGQGIHGIWNDDAAQQLRTGMLASQSPSAADVVARTLPRLDAYAGAWSAARTQTCTNALVEHTVPPSVWLRARACLDERAIRLGALLEVFGAADRTAAPRLYTATAALPAPETCADEDELARMQLLTDPLVSAVATELVHTLGRAPALEAGTRYDDGLALARDVAARAHEAGLSALAADAETWIGIFLVREGEFAEAERVLEGAFHLATREQSDLVAFRAANALVPLVGGNQQRRADGLAWGRHAQAAYDRLGAPHPELAGVLHNNLGRVLDEAGDSAAAVAEYQQALGQLESAFGPDHPEVARTLDNLASARFTLGEVQAAQRDAERALAIRESVLGPEHPDTASVHSTLGMIAAGMGDPQAAIDHYQHVLAVLEASVGPEHPEIARILHNIGECEAQRGNHAVALEWMQRANEMLERTLGPEHPNLVMSLGAMADARLALGDVAGARRGLARAQRICDAALGTEHPMCAAVRAAHVRTTKPVSPPTP